MLAVFISFLMRCSDYLCFFVLSLFWFTYSDSAMSLPRRHTMRLGTISHKLYFVHNFSTDVKGKASNLTYPFGSTQ